MALLVIDLDGTLLGPSDAVSARNLEALARARDAGFEMVLATGRSWKESRRAIAAVAHDRAGPHDAVSSLIIAAGGSVINRASDGATRHAWEIDPELVAELATLLHEHGHRAQLLKDHHASDHDYCFVGSHPIDRATHWWFDVHALERIEVSCPRDAHARRLTHRTLRVGSVAPDHALAACAAEIRRRHGDLVEARQWSALTADEFVCSRTHMLEVFARGVDKWSAVEWLCAERNSDPQRVVAIGDGANDVGMLAGAGLGIAMGNADDAVREAADAVVAPFDRDGVAEAIDLALARYGAGAAR